MSHRAADASHPSSAYGRTGTSWFPGSAMQRPQQAIVVQFDLHIGTVVLDRHSALVAAA